MPQNSSCTLCPLHSSVQNVCIWGDGPTPAEIMVVGEAPGKVEDVVGKPFVGPSGRKLESIFDQCNIPREHIYITNIVKCKPVKPNQSAAATPTATNIKACAPYLLEEIEAVKPKIIVALGGTALKHLTGKASITRAHGTPLMLRKEFGWQCPVVGVYHPAYILRTPSQENVARRDVEYAKSLLQQEPENFTVHLIQTTTELRQALARWVLAAKQNAVVAIDFETDIATGLPTVFGFAPTDTDAYIIPLFHNNSPFHATWNILLVQYIYPLLQRTQKLAAHNAKFEAEQFIKFLPSVPNIAIDTMLLAQLVDETESVNLGALAARYLRAPMWKDFDDFSFTSNLTRLAEYNGRDCIYTRRLAAALTREFSTASYARRYYKNLVQPVMHKLAEIEVRGIWVDVNRLDQNLQELQAQIAGARLALHTYKDGINFNSTKQVREWLYDELKLVPYRYTDTGAPSTDKLSLKALDHPAARALLEYRRVTRLNQFLDDLRERAMATPDHRIHPQYHQENVETGRLSSSKPNLQQTPRDPLVRGVYGSSSGLFVSWDLSQIELRIAADLAHEDTMLQAFADNVDIHLLTASRVLSKPIEAITPTERFRAKAVNFGFLFGQQAKGFRDYALREYDLRFTLEEAEDARETYFRLYPKLRDYHKLIEKRLYGSVILRAPFGRCRRLYNYKSDDAYIKGEAIREGINFAIQSTASDLCLLVMLSMPERYRVVGLVHDAILFETEDTSLTVDVAMRASLAEALDRAKILGYAPRVPIHGDLKVGSHWQ